MRTKIIIILTIILLMSFVGMAIADPEPVVNTASPVITDTPVAISSNTFSFSYNIPNSSIKIGCVGTNTSPVFIDYLYTSNIPTNGVKAYDDSINQTWVVSSDESSNGHYQIITVNSNALSSNNGWFSWL